MTIKYLQLAFSANEQRKNKKKIDFIIYEAFFLFEKLI